MKRNGISEIQSWEAFGERTGFAHYKSSLGPWSDSKLFGNNP